MVVYAPYPLGETRVQREAEALVKHGYEVDVICLRTKDSRVVDQYKGVRIYREKFRPVIQIGKPGGLKQQFLNYLIFFFNAGFRLAKLHSRKHYDSIQVHNLPDFLVFCALIPKLLGVPVILDLHDLMPEFYAGRFGKTNSLPARLIRLQERLACQFATHVITVSEHWRQALISRGVPQRKCSVVMNVADESVFYRSKELQILKTDGGPFRLVYHGAIVERYGLDLAVRAIDKIRNEIPDVHLTIIGYGDFLTSLEQLVDDLGVSKHITFMGLCLAEELPKIIRSCHIGIVPYRNDIFTDGLLPTKLMEYAALGLPAIASRTTAIQAYFEGSNVEFFEPDDFVDLARCISDLYHNPTYTIELALRSENFTKRYNWTNAGKSYVALVSGLQKS